MNFWYFFLLQLLAIKINHSMYKVERTFYCLSESKFVLFTFHLPFSFFLYFFLFLRRRHVFICIIQKERKYKEEWRGKRSKQQNELRTDVFFSIHPKSIGIHNINEIKSEKKISKRRKKGVQMKLFFLCVHFRWFPLCQKNFF